MSRRDLSTLDRDIGQPWSRIIRENIIDGTSRTEEVISQGGRIAGQTAHGPLEVSATQVYTYGTKLTVNDKIYRYCKCATGAAGVAGSLYETAAYAGGADAYEEDLAVTAASADATTVTVTLVSTGATAANAFAEGTLIFNSGAANTGGGTSYTITSSAATTGAATCALTLDEGLVVACTTGATATLAASKFKNLVIATASTAVGCAVGVPRCAIPVATPYAWFQTRGPATVLNSTGTAATVGKALKRNLDKAGSVTIDVVTSGESNITEEIGNVLAPADTSDWVTAYLTLE